MALTTSEYKELEALARKTPRTADEEKRLKELVAKAGATGAADDPLGDIEADPSGEAETVTPKDLNIIASEEALKGMLDSNLIGSAMAMGLTKQIQIEFSKTDIMQKLVSTPAKGIAQAFKSVAEKIENYNVGLIDAARNLRRATGGIVTDVEAIRSVGNVRQAVGGSLADFGITYEEVMENIKNVRGQTGDFIRFLSDRKTVDGLTTFQTKLAQLDVKLDITKIEGALSDLNNKSGPEAIKRIKEISAVADRLSKVTGVSLNKAFELTFTSAKKLIDSGNVSFDNLRKTAAASMGLVSQFGIDVPNTLNKVLPTFTEVNRMSANLSAVTQGFTFDEGAFFNQRGPERLNSIFQALRKAQQAGTFKVEEEGMARDQQVAYLTNAFKVMGMGQREVTALLRGLQEGEETMLSTAVKPLSAAELDAEVSDRIRKSLTREDIRAIPTRAGAERAALGKADDRADQIRRQREMGGVLGEIRGDVDETLKKRSEVFNQLADALGKNSITFLKMSEAIKAFSGKEGEVDAEGLIAYGLLGPPGTFPKTLNRINAAGDEMTDMFKRLKDMEGGLSMDIIPDNEEFKKAVNALIKLKRDLEELAKKKAEEVVKAAEAARSPGGSAEGADGDVGPIPPVAPPTTTALDPSKMAPLRVVVVNTKDLAEGFSGMSLMTPS
jgi:hypothetical protein